MHRHMRPAQFFPVPGVRLVREPPSRTFMWGRKFLPASSTTNLSGRDVRTDCFVCTHPRLVSVRGGDKYADCEQKLWAEENCISKRYGGDHQLRSYGASTKIDNYDQFLYCILLWVYKFFVFFHFKKSLIIDIRNIKNDIFSQSNYSFSF